MGAIRVWILSVDGLEYIVLAAKVSQGRLVGMKPSELENYTQSIDLGKLYYWMLSAVAHGHPALDYESILEHAVIRVLIEAPRYVTHQIVRHRIASYTQESQRYTEDRLRMLVEQLADMLHEKLDKFTPYRAKSILMRAIAELDKYDLAHVVRDTIGCVEDPQAAVLAVLEYWQLRAEGVALQRARALLPQCIESQLLVTLNLRELLHIASLRLSVRAQPEHARVWSTVLRDLWTLHKIPTAHLLLFKSPRTYEEAVRLDLIHSIGDEYRVWREMTEDQRKHLLRIILSRQDISTSIKNAVLGVVMGVSGVGNNVGD